MSTNHKHNLSWADAQVGLANAKKRFVEAHQSGDIDELVKAYRFVMVWNALVSLRNHWYEDTGRAAAHSGVDHETFWRHFLNSCLDDTPTRTDYNMLYRKGLSVLIHESEERSAEMAGALSEPKGALGDLRKAIESTGLDK